MTATLNGSAAAQDYPERLSVRLTPADHDLYRALGSASEALKSVTSSHIVLALLRRWDNDPQLQDEILAEAAELASERRAAANAGRKQTWQRKAQRREKT